MLAMKTSLTIKKTTLSDQICAVMKQKIKENEWAVGSKIPSENELADNFGVNRLTVRNALQKLNAMGIVETRAGEGTFVRSFDISEYIREVSELVMSPEMLDGALEFRKCIELECIKLAIQRASDTEIGMLEAALENYELVSRDTAKPFDEHINDIIEADLGFHQQLCKLSKNSLFTLAFSAVREPMYQYIKSVLIKRYNSYAATGQNRASVEATNNHRIILDAIKKRDFSASEKAYIEVVDYKNLR